MEYLTDINLKIARHELLAIKHNSYLEKYNKRVEDLSKKQASLNSEISRYKSVLLNTNNINTKSEFRKIKSALFGKHLAIEIFKTDCHFRPSIRNYEHAISEYKLSKNKYRIAICQISFRRYKAALKNLGLANYYLVRAIRNLKLS